MPHAGNKCSPSRGCPSRGRSGMVRHREAASGLLHIATWSSCRSRAAKRQIDLFAQFPAANDAFSMTFRAHANLLTTLLPSPLFQLLSTLCMQSQAKRSVLYSQRRNRRRCVEKADVITGISNVACDIYDTLRSERVGQRRQRNIIRLIISSVPCAMCALCVDEDVDVVVVNLISFRAAPR